MSVVNRPTIELALIKGSNDKSAGNGVDRETKFGEEQSRKSDGLLNFQAK